MRLYERKVAGYIKAAVIVIVLVISLLLGAFKPQETVRQTFDLKSSAIVSLGFGTTLCLILNDSKKR